MTPHTPSVPEDATYLRYLFEQWFQAELYGDHVILDRGAAKAILDDVTSLLTAVDEAINPPDREGISLDIWNKRLKAATARIHLALTRTRGEQGR